MEFLCESDDDFASDRSSDSKLFYFLKSDFSNDFEALVRDFSLFKSFCDNFSVCPGSFSYPCLIESSKLNSAVTIFTSGRVSKSF